MFSIYKKQKKTFFFFFIFFAEKNLNFSAKGSHIFEQKKKHISNFDFINT